MNTFIVLELTFSYEDDNMRRSSAILTGLMILYFAYFGYAVIELFPKLTTPAALALNSLLIFSEMLAGLFSIYLYYSIFSTVEWGSPVKNKPEKPPFVTIQIPIFNESISIVKKTLDAAMSQDYPKGKYEIIVADDSTDMQKARKVEKLCKKYGIKYVHRDHRTGFKAGALNNVTAQSRGEVIALLDADDMPNPTFISSCVSVLATDKKVAFVQTRNAERNHGMNSVTGIGRMVRDLFFGAIMKSKDNRKLAIFCGSGGAVKRSVLEEMGGWPESTVTEDIDLSTMAFSKGYTSRFINPVECRGMLPPTFTGLCGQTFRWAFGTTRTLLLRWKMIFRIPGFWRKIEHLFSCMTYVLGPAIVAIDLIMITHLVFKIPIFHMYEPKTIWIFGAMLTLSSFFALVFVQLRDGRISIKRTLHYIFVIYGLSVNFSRAVAGALLNKKFSFFRTPRQAAASGRNYHLLRRYWLEILLGVLSIGAALLRIMDPVYMAQATWLIFFGVGFLSAPYFAVKYG